MTQEPWPADPPPEIPKPTGPPTSPAGLPVEGEYAAPQGPNMPVGLMIVIIAVAVVGAVTAFFIMSALKSDEPRREIKTTHTVVYSVAGDGVQAASVNYLTIRGTAAPSLSGTPNVPLPFSRSETSSEAAAGYSLIAQVGDGTTITCTITVDGKVVATRTVTAAQRVATCVATP